MDRNYSSACNMFIAENGGNEDPPERHVFIPTRFPYTYAYDYLRGCVNDAWSRADAAGATTRWCAARDMTEEERIEMLKIFAMRYLMLHNVKV